jgi:hypothetical protein
MPNTSSGGLCLGRRDYFYFDETYAAIAGLRPAPLCRNPSRQPPRPVRPGLNRAPRRKLSAGWRWPVVPARRPGFIGRSFAQG